MYHKLAAMSLGKIWLTRHVQSPGGSILSLSKEAAQATNLGTFGRTLRQAQGASHQFVNLLCNSPDGRYLKVSQIMVAAGGSHNQLITQQIDDCLLIRGQMTLLIKCISLYS